MFKKIFEFLFVFLVCWTSSSFANENPRFIILPNIKTHELMSFNPSQAIKIQQEAIAVVKKTLDITATDPYQAVRIRLIYSGTNKVKALIVYLLSSHFKSVNIVRLNLKDDFIVQSVENNYRLQANDLKQSPYYAYKRTPACPDDTVQFVIGNNFTHDQSVEHEIQKVYQLAKQNGYHPFIMNTNDPKGPQPTVAAYENWMSCPNVKGFYNESHGFESGIILSDDDFLFSHVQKELVNKLNHEVILLDSCVTFYDPLLSAVVKDGNVQQYVAGAIYLPFGSSERTASCFWTAAFKHQELNKNLLRNCARQNGLDINGFNITGNGDKYLALANLYA